MTRIQAIRARCLDCSSGNEYERVRCTHRDCDLWPFRSASRVFRGKGYSGKRAIIKYCRWCMNGNKRMVQDCWNDDCPLHCYRLRRQTSFTKKIGAGIALMRLL
jgi:hypothetical protein